MGTLAVIVLYFIAVEVVIRFPILFFIGITWFFIELLIRAATR
jgi:hypothetical protein